MGILRLLLALAVVANHNDGFGFIKMLEGGDAVKLFFIISGFYMALVLNKKYHSNSLFYSNRVLRLYPAYALVLFLSIVWFMVIWAYTHHRPPPFWTAKADSEMQMWQWFALRFSNLTMVGLDLPALFHWKAGQGFLFLHSIEADRTSDGAEWAGWLPWIGRQAWSIGSEIWFYLLAPFVVRRHVAIQGLIASASLFLMAWMPHMGLLPYFFFPANLWLFLIGSILFRLYQSRDFSMPNWSGFLALAYVSVVVSTVGWVTNPALYTIALIIVAMCIPFLFEAFSPNKWDTAIGNLSYPVYLIHILIISVLSAAFHIRSGIVVVTVSLAAAAFITRYVDVPIDRYRQRRAQLRLNASPIHLSQMGMARIRLVAPSIPDA